MKLNKLFLFLTTLVLSLVLAACSSDNSGEGDATKETNQEMIQQK